MGRREPLRSASSSGLTSASRRTAPMSRAMTANGFPSRCLRALRVATAPSLAALVAR